MTGPQLAFLDTLMATGALVAMIAGYRAIRRKDVERHRRWMLVAFGFSVGFLLFFVPRVGIYGVETTRLEGVPRVVAIVLATFHEPPAVIVTPLVIVSLLLGLGGRYREHKEVASFTFPLWIYVSVTGILTYLLLYQVL